MRLAIDTGDEDAEVEVRTVAGEIKNVERRLNEARQPTADDLAIRQAVEQAERQIGELRRTIRDRATLRRDLQRLFPRGLHATDGKLWDISGDAHPGTFEGVGTPTASPTGRGGTPRGID